MLLISANAPSRYATEAFTWSTTFLVGGLGAGHALGGSIVEAHGARAVFGAAAGRRDDSGDQRVGRTPAQAKAD